MKKPTYISWLGSELTMMFFLLLLMGVTFASEEADPHSGGVLEEEDHEIPPAHAVLFPSFALTLGVLVYFILSRYLHLFPYTAVMFIIGTVMGIGAEVLDNTDDHINESLRLWIPIDSEVLLLVFLPGLIFKDAFGLNVHLFKIALPQCLIFAFPMVLAGTTLTALVAFYIFPYNWSFNLAMTFGSILSATDPVAVAALLEEVGAPPRLKVHIGGEALLNDGAAIVFFGIFADRYFHELGIVGFGEDIDLATGVATFFQKSLGGVAIGIFFGLGLLVLLYIFDRRFNREENVVQVTATLAIAYIGYYVAEPVWQTSGVIATLSCGVLVKLFGRAMVNDTKLLDDFWTLVEHLLNTVLFTLGGVVWGAVIASDGVFQAKDWGYLFVLYIFLHLIRGVSFMSVYPMTCRIGLKTNLYETYFQIYGGLRGAVGISLALFLDNEIRHEIGDDPTEEELEFQLQTRKLFGFVGGIAFLTLSVNGSTAGPFLRWLGLSDSTETRKRIIDAYQARYKAAAIGDFVRLLTQERFKQVNFALVAHHVPILADLTKVQLLEAVERHKETTPHAEYHPPYLKHIVPYLKDEPEVLASSKADESLLDQDAELLDRKIRHEERSKKRMKKRMRMHSNRMGFLMGGEPLSAHELRQLFISILRSVYEEQIRNGELESQAFLAVSLMGSLDLAADAVSNGEPLQDWQHVMVADGTRMRATRSLTQKPKRAKLKENLKHNVEKIDPKRAAAVKRNNRRLRIERSLAFMAAHQKAQTFFQREFLEADNELSEAGKLIIAESQTEYNKAAATLRIYEPEVVADVVSHKFCSILLNSGVIYIGNLVEIGLLKDEEAEHFIHEIEHNLDGVLSCDLHFHPGEMSAEEEEHHSHHGTALDPDDWRLAPAITEAIKEEEEDEPEQPPKNVPVEEEDLRGNHHHASVGLKSMPSIARSGDPFGPAP